MTCRVTLLHMQADGQIRLPLLQMLTLRRRPQSLPSVVTDALPPLVAPVHELGSRCFRCIF